MIKTFALFGLTAIAEIVGCYLPYLWLKHGKSAWLLVPAALALALFAWLLTLHPTEGAGRVYAAYGGVYVGTALLWLWLVDGIRPSGWDVLGSLVAIAGMLIIMFAPRAG
ncbi:YnfA family protein [Stutzerimonas nosocomialis]|uniref:YnfA family protein n=1 Tax=Stutzerimonas nosocomialis TaxID=1056496 RepID=A0A5R9QHS1_9GAMM|nr:YnfA family protein [Stutzerimonas nosocomialis]TLX64610.1 YnfA family protein [Stutzerimonas nosocomialis]